MTWRLRLEVWACVLFCCIAIPTLWAFNNRPRWLRNRLRNWMLSIPDEAFSEEVRNG